jgi:hypothetical protein
MSASATPSPVRLEGREALDLYLGCIASNLGAITRQLAVLDGAVAQMRGQLSEAEGQGVAAHSAAISRSDSSTG